jgi:hypothetical protein
VANDGDKIAVTPRLDPNDAKTVVSILVGDPFNQPGQYLPIGLLRLHLHDVHRTDFVARRWRPGAEVLRDPAPSAMGAHDVAISAIRAGPSPPVWFMCLDTGRIERQS